MRLTLAGFSPFGFVLAFLAAGHVVGFGVVLMVVSPGSGRTIAVSSATSPAGSDWDRAMVMAVTANVAALSTGGREIHQPCSAHQLPFAATRPRRAGRAQCHPSAFSEIGRNLVEQHRVGEIELRAWAESTWRPSGARPALSFEDLSVAELMQTIVEVASIRTSPSLLHAGHALAGVTMSALAHQPPWAALSPRRPGRGLSFVDRGVRRTQVDATSTSRTRQCGRSDQPRP